MRAQMLKEALASQEELVALVDRVLDATKVVGDIPVANAEAVNVQHLLQEVLAHLASGDLASYTLHLQVSEPLPPTRRRAPPKGRVRGSETER